MAIDINTVADEKSTTPANSEDTSGLPTAILELPIFAGLLQGAPAAVWTPTGDKSPEAVTAVKYGKDLNKVGMFFYRDDKEKIDLLYNAQYVSPELIKEAAKKGKLKEVASPLSEVSAQLNGAVAGGGAAPAGPGGVPSPVPVDSALNTARVDNLTPGGPTSGPLPGAGRVLNNLVTPVV